ncbi:GH36-type glycosyl hydrolase domain-containing protein [Limnohabitans planktonicus]|uniref:Cyclic beta 1-2 glucan synthetase n=1 Tax=Limnohabitans planktonicus II-D5 TaxID=1293045 RepID=A0A2T7U9M4_9BURK|nr:glucoamylase family protein [Limnohabitans planktonicus]PVE41395.1 cyclic beta 1-2 glucan synthetase [Limnohabitans planktonicus II-D5]
MHRLKALRASWLRALLPDLFQPAAPASAAIEVPLRAELFNTEQMERHGKNLAQIHSLSTASRRDQLLVRLGDNEDVLQSACTLLLEAVHQTRRITPAGEWLLDNFYLIEEQILTARAHFSKSYGRELPVLANGPSKGLPRVYDIALEVIAHGDGRIDPENLTRFVAAYQSMSELTLGELWAIPIMLRLALIENLRRISAGVAESMVERNRAAGWAEQILHVAEHDPKNLILVISDMARASPTLVNTFVAELARLLQGHSAALALPLTWIAQHLSELDQSIEQMVQSETQAQAINQVCISNSIASLRMLSATDWREFVESLSGVERKLREDPQGVYGRMDFSTRDRYRHVVEKTARHSGMSEFDVASLAVHLAQSTLDIRKAQDDEATPNSPAASEHVGHYLVGEGLPVLERAAQVRYGVLASLQRWARTMAVPLYLGAMALLTVLVTTLLLQAWWGLGLEPWLWWLLVPVALLASSQLAVTLVNWVSTQLVTPHVLPRMDFSDGIAPEARTLVVVPTMLDSLAGVQALVEALEVRFLANQDPHLHFGLLTDWTDSATEHAQDDAPLLDLAIEGITALNRKYPGVTQDTFFLFHRARQLNVQEKVWMGYERKRGKLGALNALLRGQSDAGFLRVVGNAVHLQQVRYVITLDTDTQLQRDTARKFSATMAHPLNRPQLDPRSACVTAGYGILQPRMAVSLQSTNRSRYARLMGSEAGVDPYTRAVSDVYQDLFQEGSFIGKGIYDVDAFEAALNGRFPENRILSHDLLEGCYVRSGLLSDVQLYDDFPARYDSDVKRRSRWIRGDWQIASWLWPRVPAPAGSKRPKNPLSLLSQWKILDNLRRSLVAAALVGLLVLGWTQLDSTVPWTLSVLSLLLLAPALNSLVALVRRPRDLPWHLHVRRVLHGVFEQLAQAALTLVLLPHEAWFSLDAIVRTHVRMLFTHRRLLEWQASDALGGDAALHKAHCKPGGLRDLLASAQQLAAAPILAMAAAVGVALLNPAMLGQAAPVLLLWLTAPLLAWWISRPLASRREELSVSQRHFLRRMARRTWSFFEQFVNAENHWLPPDNFQEHPVADVDHRTSPTNMGLSLLATLTAYDLGYISVGNLLERSNNSLQSMLQLERHAGHFYNWYDTKTLEPLLPRYVSSVDSGNLSGHLLTLRPALLALADQPIFHPHAFDGLLDTMSNLNQAMPRPAGPPLRHALAHLTQSLEAARAAQPFTPADALQWLVGTETLCTAMLMLLEADAAVAGDAHLRHWSQTLLAQCTAIKADWLGLQPQPHAWAGDPPDAIPTLRALAAAGNVLAQSRMALIEQLAQTCASMASADYSFLYDNTRHLIAVGYNLDERRRDSGHYDLLASEARLCSFVAIAQGNIPQDNWFALGRLLTTAGNSTALLSWSGSMFEYLMPNLVMPSYANTLLHQTCESVVQAQIAYGELHGVPWGISESGYNTMDAALNYQYRAFGVPGLGLKRGLSEDLVIAPYATALALMVQPDAACRNLQRLVQEGMEGRYGMFEAMDYTPARVPRGQSGAVVRSYMAHHQGMSLLAFAHVLLDQPMQKRFTSDPLFQATTLLLQERIPNAAVFYARAQELPDIRRSTMGQTSPLRVLRNPDAAPEVHLLSNGRYHVMVSQSGAGYSRWKDLAITRWREDGTRDSWGAYCYLRDVDSGQFWSATHQPALQHSDSYEAIFTEGRAEFRRRDHGFETHTDMVVSPEDDIELRRTRITNHARTRRTIEITSYAEVVLAPSAGDNLHQAFSNLFVQTEIVQERQAILCHRRPRSENESVAWMFHLMAVHGADAQTISYETDRKAFVGRMNGLDDPQALRAGALLGDSQGPVLDPIVAIRQRITLQPQQTVTVDMVTGVAEMRGQALCLIDKYRDMHLADRVVDLATTHAWVNLQQINASEADAQLFARLASSVIYLNPAQRAQQEVLVHNKRSQSGLWGYGVSGDLPIVLLQISSVDNIELVRQMVQAIAYWRLKGLEVDLVIWNEDHAGYRQALQEQIMGLIAVGLEANRTDRPGGIFVRSSEHMPAEDRTLFQTVARVIITDTQGSLKSQASRHMARKARAMPLPLTPEQGSLPASSVAVDARRSDRAALQFFNGLGGFSEDGREYVIHTTVSDGVAQHCTPQPWVNVIANDQFGTVISESGSAYTWSENAHEFRFTPWSNDAVSDSPGEAIYLRDEASGVFWSPTALPCGADGLHVTRHGFGYSVFEHTHDGIDTELTVFVDLQASIKFSQLRVRNHSGRSRKLSATGYVEWVLGDLQPKSAMHVSTEIDPHSGAILARNPYNTVFGDRMAFFDADAATRAHGVSVTGDRREFLGRNGTLHHPAAMHRVALSNRIGSGLDPCAAVQVPFELSNGQERVVVFRLGAAGRRGQDDVGAMVQRLRDERAIEASLESVHAYWRQTLGVVQVQTPDAALNLLANGWLLYQTLACRLWARTGFYQSGGAFGFRDQLQDAMALVHAAPQLLREHLLRCAARQFREGDVQHWWHPPQGRGVRTRCSDDYLWLVQATCHYVNATGDATVLHETAPFLQGRELNAEEDSYYDLPAVTDERATVYEHCVRAIRNGLGKGVHGLPLMGSGDWNDGMNLVGIKGQGESIWLAFFLIDTLKRFGPLARGMGDHSFADQCMAEAEQLRLAIDQQAWDGAWYRRAYFDDGTPLGSTQNDECQIDSVTQSWAVLSGAGQPTRNRSALDALDLRLVRRDLGLIQLLTPPFDQSALNPGYIKGYLPGVRENGGQYTHAAIWAVMAFAALGDQRRAWECFDLINPLHHGSSAQQVARYQVEPYVMAADVYAVAPHEGRGGWTWYTGSAGWMYRLILESLLGLRLQGASLHFSPCLPDAWPGFALQYRFGQTVYAIEVQKLTGSSALVLVLDGEPQAGPVLPLQDDGVAHRVVVQVPA